MKHPTCETCDFFCLIPPSERPGVGNHNHQAYILEGECRKRPPTVLSTFPVVAGSTWCGGHSALPVNGES